MIDNSKIRKMKLVDYDGMFGPSLSGKKAVETGHPNYQHPKRELLHFSRNLDNFSCISIFISLYSIMKSPFLWEKFHTDDALLFTKKDYIDPFNSKVFNYLENMESPIPSMVRGFKRIINGNISNLPSLDTYLDEYAPIVREEIQKSTDERKKALSKHVTQLSEPMERKGIGPAPLWTKTYTKRESRIFTKKERKNFLEVLDLISKQKSLELTQIIEEEGVQEIVCPLCYSEISVTIPLKLTIVDSHKENGHIKQKFSVWGPEKEYGIEYEHYCKWCTNKFHGIWKSSKGIREGLLVNGVITSIQENPTGVWVKFKRDNQIFPGFIPLTELWPFFISRTELNQLRVGHPIFCEVISVKSDIVKLSSRRTILYYIDDCYKNAILTGRIRERTSDIYQIDYIDVGQDWILPKGKILIKDMGDFPKNSFHKFYWVGIDISYETKETPIILEYAG